MCRHACLASLTLLTLTACAVAQEPLEWKLKKGETFFVEIKTSKTGSVTIAGKVTLTESVSTVVARFTVVDRTKEHHVIEEEILLVSDKSTGGMTSFSKAAYKALLEPDTVAKKKGATFKIRLRPSGQLQFNGYEEAVKRLAGSNEAALKMLKELMPESYWKGFVSDIFSVVPVKPVGKGKEWERSAQVGLGRLGNFTTEYRYVQKTRDRNVATIGVTAAMKYAAPEKPARGLLFEITGGTIASKDARGSLLFDVAAGRLIRSSMEIPLAGSLTIKIGDKKTTLQVEQRQTVECRLLDYNPLKP